MGIISDIIKAHADKKDDFISEWYWRRNYNKLKSQMDQLIEVMRSDVYKKVIDDLSNPLILERYKRENERLRNKCSSLIDERDALYEVIKVLKKKGGKDNNGDKEAGTTK